jgi:DNA-binding response OmpR family regulator
MTAISRFTCRLQNEGPISHLSETLNRTLERMESGVRGIRDFTANAAHELRTPLALIRIEVEVALSGTEVLLGRQAIHLCGRHGVRVLVVEDEPRLAENIAIAMREGAGYAVDCTHSGDEALLLCETATYDLIVLDLMIPGMRGEDVLRKLRSRKDLTPILILTAVAETQSTIDLLNTGADDYMTKPFDLGELIARGRALVRRGKGVKQTLLSLGALTMDITEQTVRMEGNRVELSPTEYRILEYLMHRPQAVVSKRELLEHLYDFTWEHHSNVIEAHVSNLRRKLKLASEVMLVETLRGRGYRLSTAV